MPDQPDDVLKSIKNKLILLDRAMVSTDDNYPTSYHLPLEDLAEFIAEQVQEARIEGGQVSINTEIPKKITGFESMPAMSICRNLTVQDAKINEIIDYLSQLALKENKQ